MNIINVFCDLMQYLNNSSVNLIDRFRKCITVKLMQNMHTDSVVNYKEKQTYKILSYRFKDKNCIQCYNTVCKALCPVYVF